MDGESGWFTSSVRVPRDAGHFAWKHSGPILKLTYRGLRYKPVIFGTGKSSGEANWKAGIERERG